MRTGRRTMEKQLPDRQAFGTGVPPAFGVVMWSLLFMLALAGTATAQQIAVTGTVPSPGGTPLQGVVVRVQGVPDSRAVSAANGRYFINAPANGTLAFSLLGTKPASTPVAGRTRIDVVMSQVSYLEEVVVTAYTEQRRADITGAVASVNMESANRQTGASVIQRLDVAVPGITVAASGSPRGRRPGRVGGDRALPNNHPPHVRDATPDHDSELNLLHP